nr:MAG TPA: hypothetical protein [Caudoviricetes sp.]
MSSYLKTGGFYEQDDFVEDSGQLRELTVTITLSEYRELVALSVLQRDCIDQIDDLKEGMDFLCRVIMEAKPDLAPYVIDAGKTRVPLSALEALFRFAKDGDADA